MINILFTFLSIWNYASSYINSVTHMQSTNAEDLLFWTPKASILLLLWTVLLFFFRNYFYPISCLLGRTLNLPVKEVNTRPKPFKLRFLLGIWILSRNIRTDDSRADSFQYWSPEEVSCYLHQSHMLPVFLRQDGSAWDLILWATQYTHNKSFPSLPLCKYP